MHTLSRRLRAGLVATLVFAVGCASWGSGGDGFDASSDEVQVGYGTQERGEVTGAVVSVRAEDFHGEITSWEDLFQGLAGVTFRRLSTGGFEIRIRGATGLSSDGEPLFVINGVPMRAARGQALMGVNPREVTRIDVLKDSGAAAIYGSRGANGVVLVFTRRR